MVCSITVLLDKWVYVPLPAPLLLFLMYKSCIIFGQFFNQETYSDSCPLSYTTPPSRPFQETDYQSLLTARSPPSPPTQLFWCPTLPRFFQLPPRMTLCYDDRWATLIPSTTHSRLHPVFPDLLYWRSPQLMF